MASTTKVKDWSSAIANRWPRSQGAAGTLMTHGIKLTMTQDILDAFAAGQTSWAIADILPDKNFHELKLKAAGGDFVFSLGCQGHCRDECTNEIEQENLTGILECKELADGACEIDACGMLNCMSGATCGPSCCEHIKPFCPDPDAEPEEIVESFKPEPHKIVITLCKAPTLDSCLELIFQYTNI